MAWCIVFEDWCEAQAKHMTNQCKQSPTTPKAKGLTWPNLTDSQGEMVNTHPLVKHPSWLAGYVCPLTHPQSPLLSLSLPTARRPKKETKARASHQLLTERGRAGMRDEAGAALTAKKKY